MQNWPSKDSNQAPLVLDFLLHICYLFVCFFQLIHGLKKEKTIFCELTNLPSTIDILGICFFIFTMDT